MASSSIVHLALAGGGLVAGVVAGGALGLAGDPLTRTTDPIQEEEADGGEVSTPEEQEKPVIDEPVQDPEEEEPEAEPEGEVDEPEGDEEPMPGDITNALVVAIDGIYVAHDEFISVSGVVSESDPEGEGIEYHPLVLERLYRGDDDLYAWHERVADGDIVRRNMTITLTDGAGHPLRAVVLEQAWPTAWERSGVEEGSDEPGSDLITFSSETVYERAP